MISIITIGDWERQQLQTSNVPNTRQSTPEIDLLIEQSWTLAMARPGVTLFDGQMCRLESWKASPGLLQLSLSQTTYKTFLGTNLAHPELAATQGRAVMANPLGLSAAILSADGFLIFGRRNASVAYYPDRVHPFAGCLEPRDDADVFAAIERELAEELGFTAVDISDIRCRGIVEDPALLQPELIFKVQSNRTRAEIERLVDADEHHGSWSIAATPTAIKFALTDPALTPVAIGAMMLCK